MNYKRIYDQLIIRGKNRRLNEYKEKHHIIPRCLGGSDDANNLVFLTPEEHYVAHQLLIKIYPDNVKLIYAAAMMIPNRKSNKLYGWLKRKFSLAKSKEQNDKGNSQYNTIWMYHSLFGAKKINKDMIVEYIDQGWILGKVLKYCKTKKRREYTTKEKRNNDIHTYREYYMIYSKYGYKKFVEITGYKYSKANLVQRFAKLLPEFSPQNGKKR